MEFTYSRINLPPYAGGQDPPHDVIRRNEGEVWLVPHAPVCLDRPIDWRHQRREDAVYVPLFPYLVPAEPDLALGFMLQLGIRLAGNLESRANVLRVHLALGHPVNEVVLDPGGPVWQYQVGFALRIK